MLRPIDYFLWGKSGPGHILNDRRRRRLRNALQSHEWFVVLCLFVSSLQFIIFHFSSISLIAHLIECNDCYYFIIAHRQTKKHFIQFNNNKFMVWKRCVNVRYKKKQQFLILNPMEVFGHSTIRNRWNRFRLVICINKKEKQNGEKRREKNENWNFSKLKVQSLFDISFHAAFTIANLIRIP